MAYSTLWTAVALTMGAGGIPISLASKGLLIPIQVWMLATISRIFGIKAASVQFWMNLVGSLLASLTVVNEGIISLQVLVKFIPFIGPFTGALILGFVSSLTTQQLGDWYINFLVERMESSKGKPPSLKVIKASFKEFLHRISGRKKSK